MEETSNGFTNATEKPAPSKDASEHELEANSSEVSSSKTEEVYPMVKSLCEGLFSHRVQRKLAYEQTVKEIENSKNGYRKENSEDHEMRKRLNHLLQTQGEVKRKRNLVAERLFHLQEIKENAERKVMLEKSKDDACNEDAKNLSTWFPERLFNIEKFRREKEEFARQLEIQKVAKTKAVDSELQRRKDLSEGRDRIKNRRRNDMRKITEDKNSRLEDLRQKFDQFVSSNQRGQELSMLEEKLKKVQYQNVQRSTEIQAAKLKEEEDLVSLNNSMQTIQRAIIHAEKETNCENEILKVKEACNSITEDHNMIVEEIQEGAKEEEKTIVEVKLLLLESSLKSANEKNDIEREVASLQNRLKQFELERDHLITRNEFQQRGEALMVELAKTKENNKMIAEEVDIFESLFQYSIEKTDENAEALKEKETELEEIPCNHTSQKIELRKMRKLKEEQGEQLLVKKHRLLQIERSIADLEGSIKSMRDQHVHMLSNSFGEEGKKRADIEELEKSKSQLRDAIKMLENDRKQLNAELTDLFTKTSDCQDELKKLKEAKMDFEQMSLSHAEYIRTKQVETEDFRSNMAAAEQDYKKLLENSKECERLFEALSDKVSKVMTPQKDALLKDSDEAIVLDTSLMDKKPMLSQIETSGQEEKLRLEEKKTQLDEMTSRLKEQLDLLDEQKSENAKRVEVAEQELARINEKKLDCKKEHEEVLYAYDSAADKLLQVKDKYALIKKQKIKLLNMCDMVEKVTTDTEAKDNKAIESMRADLHILKNKYTEMVNRHNEHLEKLKRQLAAFDVKIAEIKEKRKVEKENITAGLPAGPKPILKSPGSDGDEAKLKKSVSFGDSPDNLQILHSDSSVEVISGSSRPKRKLLPPLQEKTKTYGKSRRTSSSGRTVSE